MALGDYAKTAYVNGAAPGISAARLNNNENKTAELDTGVTAHLADYVRHITAEERTSWNGKATTANYTAEVTTTWDGASAPYTQTITVTGILSTDEPIIFPVFSSINATAILEQAAWDLIGEITTGVDSITITCFEKKPVTTINIQLKVVR